MLQIHYSNRLEPLADVLIAQLAQPADPFAQIPVGLPSRLLGRWLSLRMALSQGVSANLDLRLHAELVWDCLRILNPGLERDNRFAPANLRWAIYAQLDHLPGDDRFGALQRYLAPLDQRGRLAFSERLAGLFDRYLVYRPAMMREWEAGKAHSWQGVLWQRLQLPHRMHWAKLSVDSFDNPDPAAIAQLPATLHLFAMPAFSPSFLDVLNRLGQWRDIHLYQWNPTPEYWGQVRAPRSKGQMDLFDPSFDSGLAGQWLDSGDGDAGNTLLASWGQQLKECFELVQDYSLDPREYYADNFSPSLLGVLQRRLFNLEQVENDDLSVDDSVRVHICHSPRREVEVCYDFLLDAFAQDSDLSLEDILVVTAKLDDYAPYINAVFGSAPAPRRLSYQLIGARENQNEAMFAVRLLLSAMGRGIDANELLELLRCEPVRRRFGFARRDFGLLDSWLEQAGLFRGPGPLVGDEKFQWLAVARRLLVSAMMAEPDNFRTGQWVPTLSVPLAEFPLLGKLVGVLETITAFAQQTQHARSMLDWCTWFNRLLGASLQLDRTTNEQLTGCRQGLAELIHQSQLVEFDDSVSFELFVDCLVNSLSGQGAASYFSGAGGIRFCSAAVGRLLPAKVIYVLGLNDGAFPRPLERSDIDLMLANRQRGDRSARDDDRQLFLEWLVTAQRQLVLSYVGRSPRDNSALAASPLIDELLGYLDDRGVGNDATNQPLSAQVSALYPMHPFAAESADREANNTFASQYSRPAQSDHQAIDDEQGQQINVALEPVIELDDLLEFFNHPAKYFYQRRLNLVLEQLDQDDDQPPLQINQLTAYKIRQLLLQNQLPADTKQLLHWLQHRADIASGTLGDAALAEQVYDVYKLRSELGDVQQHWLAVDLALASHHRLRGELSLLGDSQRVHPGKLRAKHRLRHWLEHLVLSAATDGPQETRLKGLDKTIAYNSVADPGATLQSLLDIFLLGQIRPLVLPPETCLAFVTAGHSRRSKLSPAEAARGKYQERDFGEGNDLWNQLATREADWLNDDFKQCAADIWLPLQRHEDDRNG